MYSLTSIRKSTWSMRILLVATGVFVTTNLAACGGGTNSVKQVVTETGRKITLTAEQYKMAEQEIAKKEATLSTVAAIEKNLQLKPDGTLALVSANSRAVTLTEEQEKFAELALAKTNSLVKEGSVTVDEKYQVHLTDAGRANYNFIKIYWWGFEIGIKSDIAKKLVHIVALGGVAVGAIAAAAVVLFPPAAPVAGVLAAYIALQAAWIEVVSDYGGVLFHLSWWNGGWIWFE